MADLPSEIITEILSRLPVKSLLRFRCVCKSWNSLIKTSNFIKLQLNQTLISSSDFHLLLWSEGCSSMYFAELNSHHNHLHFSELHHPLNTQGISFFGSCNGVVCMSDSSQNDVVLYNPLTKSVKSHLSLPLPANNHDSNGSNNDNNIYTWYGFGYDSKNDDYKVLRIDQGFKCDMTYCNEAKVFSLNNFCWKSVQAIPHFMSYRYTNGVLVNEVLHYLVSIRESDSKLGEFIAGFDLRTETFSLMDFANYDHKLRSDSDLLDLLLTELGDCLSVMVNYHTNAYAHMLPVNPFSNYILYRADFWVMKEYGNKDSWVRLFSMNISELMNIRSIIGFRPVYYSKDGRRLLIERNACEVGWFDLVSKQFTELASQLTSHGLPNKILNIACFVGSLVLLEDKLHSKRGSLPMKNRNRKNSDKFLSVGFKLKL